MPHLTYCVAPTCETCHASTDDGHAHCARCGRRAMPGAPCPCTGPDPRTDDVRERLGAH